MPAKSANRTFGRQFPDFQWCASSKIRHSPRLPRHSEAMYAVSFGNCFSWMGCDGSAICWRTAFQNSNLSSTAIQFNFVPQLATMNCTVPVRISSRMRLWSRCRTRPPCNVPLSSQSSLSGNFVTIRWSGFNPSAFRPSSRIYHDLVQVRGKSGNRTCSYWDPLYRLPRLPGVTTRMVIQ